MAKFSLKQMLAFLTLLLVAIFCASLPYVVRVKTAAQGRMVADDAWESHAVIYKWPLSDSVAGGIRVTNHVDRSSGLMIERRDQSAFRNAYNGRIQELLNENGVPEYSLAPILPSDLEIRNIFFANTLEPIGELPCSLTLAIRINFDSALRIRTNRTEYSNGMSMTVDWGDLPIHTHSDGDIHFVRYGGQWMGVFHTDGRLLFEVN